MTNSKWTPADIGCKLMPCDPSRPLMELWAFDQQPTPEERELCIAYAATTELLVYGLVTSDPAPNVTQIRDADLMFFPERFGSLPPGTTSSPPFASAPALDHLAPDHPWRKGTVPMPE